MKKIKISVSVAFIYFFSGAMGDIMLLFVIILKKEAEAVSPPDNSSIIENKSLVKAVNL